MAFEIPADLHPNLVPVAFLLGQWHGNGHGDYPTIDAFQFGQELGFTHDGRPFLHYFSRTWITDEQGSELRPSAIETGFLRVNADQEVEFLLVHPTGFAEIYHGSIDGARLVLSTDAVARTVTAKEYAAGHRLYGLVEGDLLWTFDMAAMGQPLQPHIWARLQRTVVPGRSDG